MVRLVGVPSNQTVDYRHELMLCDIVMAFIV